MNDAETEQRPKDGQRVKGGGGIYAQGKEIFDFIYQLQDKDIHEESYKTFKNQSLQNHLPTQVGGT